MALVHQFYQEYINDKKTNRIIIMAQIEISTKNPFDTFEKLHKLSISQMENFE